MRYPIIILLIAACAWAQNVVAPSASQAPQPFYWMEARFQTGYSNGANVTSLIDSSGNGNTATQIAGCNSPSTPTTYVANVLNGYPAIRFAQNSAGACFGFNNATVPVYIMAVVMSTNSSSYETIIGAGASQTTPHSGPGAYRFMARNDPGRTWNVNRTTDGFGGTLTIGDGKSTGIGYYYIQEGELTTTAGACPCTVYEYINGVSVGTPPTASTGSLATPTTVLIGNDYVNGIPDDAFTGDIVAILAFSTDPTTAQKSAWRQYLASTYFRQPANQCQYIYYTFDDSNIWPNLRCSVDAASDWAWNQNLMYADPTNDDNTTGFGPVRDSGVLEWNNTPWMIFTPEDGAGECNNYVDLASAPYADRSSWIYSITISTGAITGACSGSSGNARSWSPKLFLDSSSLPHAVVALSSTAEVPGAFMLYLMNPTTCSSNPSTCMSGAWSTPVSMALTGTTSSIIDGSIFLQGNTYWLFANLKDTSRVGLWHQVGALTPGSWILDSTDLLTSHLASEGPFVNHLSNGANRVYSYGGAMYYSDCAAGQAFNACTWSAQTAGFGVIFPSSPPSGYTTSTKNEQGTFYRLLSPPVNSILSVGSH